MWLVFIESWHGQKQETGDLGILNPIYSRELNNPDVAHARAAVCVVRCFIIDAIFGHVQWPASTACLKSRGAKIKKIKFDVKT